VATVAVRDHILHTRDASVNKHSAIMEAYLERAFVT